MARGTVNDGNNGGNYNITFVSCETGAISPRTVTVTGITAESKEYDGTRTATLDVSHAKLVGVISLDDVELDTSDAAGVFESKNIGDDKTVEIEGLKLTGDDAGNYELTQPETTADITGVPVRLAFSRSPRDAMPGVAFSTQPVVLVQDSNGRTVTDSSLPVTLSLVYTSGQGDAVLMGTVTVNADDGVATFSGLAVDRAGSGLALRATSGSLTAAQSASFNSLADPDVLVFAQSPVGPLSRSAFTVQPVVHVQRPDGSTVSNSAVPVTLRIKSGSGAAGAHLSGSLTANAVNGIATFSGLSIDLAGTGYVLEAVSDDWAPGQATRSRCSSQPLRAPCCGAGSLAQ